MRRPIINNFRRRPASKTAVVFLWSTVVFVRRNYKILRNFVEDECERPVYDPMTREKSKIPTSFFFVAFVHAAGE